MKKLLFILLILPAVLLATPVDPNLAQQIALNFINSTGDSLNAQHPINQPRRLKRVTKQTADTSPYYIFNNEDGGFVIVSGDDCATPILGYSNEGSIDLDNMPIQLEELLDAYAAEIQYAVDNNLQATDEVVKSWNLYRKAPQSRTTTAVVNALITTSWNQYPLYNDKCPSDASFVRYGGHPTSGCVAVAMAQIMKYWNHPKQGVGNKSYRTQRYGTLSANFANTIYDWENMPSALSSSTTEAQNNAVATLMYHCGVAVEMEYNSNGEGSSGAQVIDDGSNRACTEKALKTYFKYASTLKGKKWTSSISLTTWKNMLKNELDNQRPVLYSGHTTSGVGHAFICDGYDSDDLFHFNWGWGGQADGFFSLTALTGGGYNFSKSNQAIIGIEPADESVKYYDLYMNTDLTAINTSNTGSSLDVNPYKYGNTISFTAKVENNGIDVFNGSFRVAAFTYEGEFIAWSNESYHFSLGAGKVTEKKTYTFTGGYPFIPGKYRAYLCYKDDDDTEWKYVKTDQGVLMTEYNNVAFSVKILSGELITNSAFTPDEFFGSFSTGSKLRIYVDIRNTALLSAFYGKIRLNLYNTDGSRAQIIEEKDFTQNGLSSSTTYSLNFFNYLEVEPGTYYMALVYQKKNETSWYYMRSSDDYPNPVKIIITAPELFADEYEENNTQATATSLNWFIDDEMEDFGTSHVTLHEDSDVDYYKLSFTENNRYTVHINLYDKYNPGGWWYENADAQLAYSIDGVNYSEFYRDSVNVTFAGPATLFIVVQPYGMNGLGYYKLAGDIEETANPYIQDLTCAQASQIASGLNHNTPTTETYNVLGYVTETDGVVSRGQQIFWMADTENGGRVFESYWCNVPEEIKVGDYVSVKGQIMRYNSTYEIKHGDVILLERKSREAIEDIEVNGNPTKLLRNGQILIQRGDRTYTVTGQEIK
jgi:hypothetical protein